MTNENKTPDLVSVHWLNEHRQDDQVLIIDARMSKTVDGKKSAFAHKYIPGAIKADIESQFSDQSSAFPNTFPSAEQFELEAQKLGINQDSHVVVYDDRGVYSSPRVWWLFKTMGLEKVSVLDGGLPAWVEAGFETEENLSEQSHKGNFQARLQAGDVKMYEDVVSNIDVHEFDIVDARSKGRFDGTSPEPRAHLKSGHIPHSFCIPYSEVLDNGRFKSEEELRKIFSEVAETGRTLTFSCGSGLTACIVLLAAKISGLSNLSVYDGSWTEWAERQNLFTTNDEG